MCIRDSAPGAPPGGAPGAPPGGGPPPGGGAPKNGAPFASNFWIIHGF